MTCECPESFGPQVRRFSSHDLHKLFGNRKFRNYSIFATVATGIRLSETFEPPSLLGMLSISNGVPPVPPCPAPPRPSIVLVLISVLAMGLAPAAFDTV